MKSPLNRGGLRFYLVIIALLGGHLAVRRDNAPFDPGRPAAAYCLGVWLHTWAKGCLRQNRVVATIGPYRFVRHPFYLANALIDVGTGGDGRLVAAGSRFAAVVAGDLYSRDPRRRTLFMRQVSRRLSRIPPARAVPDSLATPPALSGRRLSLDNPNIAGGEELPRAVRILAYPLLFFVAQGLRGGGLEWFQGTWSGWNLTGVCGLLALYASAWQVNRHQRQRCPILPRGSAAFMPRRDGRGDFGRRLLDY